MYAATVVAILVDYCTSAGCYTRTKPEGVGDGPDRCIVPTRFAITCVVNVKFSKALVIDLIPSSLIAEFGAGLETGVLYRSVGLKVTFVW